MKLTSLEWLQWCGINVRDLIGAHLEEKFKSVFLCRCIEVQHSLDVEDLDDVYMRVSVFSMLNSPSETPRAKPEHDSHYAG